MITGGGGGSTYCNCMGSAPCFQRRVSSHGAATGSGYGKPISVLPIWLPRFQSQVRYAYARSASRLNWVA